MQDQDQDQDESFIILYKSAGPILEVRNNGDVLLKGELVGNCPELWEYMAN